MRVSLNLARKPFGRNRMFYALSGAAGLVLVTTAVVMAVLFVRSFSRSPELTRESDAYRRQLSDLARKQNELETVLRRPENAPVLHRSVFLNQLLYRKAVSWTRTFADLEKVMPPRVRLVAVRPWLDADNRINLEMHVGAESREAFVEFLKGIEDSELFESPEVQSDSPPTENQPLYRYRMRVVYDQKL